jgi:hypothetical protein
MRGFMRGDASAGPNPGGGFYGAPNNFDIGDQILRAAIREQVGSIVRRLHRGGAIDNRIEFRIGVHQGDIVVEDDDIFGDGVNVAARLEALAEPGSICVSARVQEDVAGRLDLTFDDIGERSLKNIARPVRVYRVRFATAENKPTVTSTETRPRVRRNGGALAAFLLPWVVYPMAADNDFIPKPGRSMYITSTPLPGQSWGGRGGTWHARPPGRGADGRRSNCLRSFSWVRSSTAALAGSLHSSPDRDERRINDLARSTQFVPDSLLEGAGFEPSVPQEETYAY